MKIVHVLRQTAHGPLSFEHLFGGDRGVTGSEQSMLLLMESQAAAGHTVVGYLPTSTPGFSRGVELIDVNGAWPRLRRCDTADVVISWLSSDSLRNLGPKPLKIHAVQINDWFMCAPGHAEHVNVFVACSESHRRHLASGSNRPLDTAAWAVIPNGVDCARFIASKPRIPRRCVYLSSPDRGLHWVLAMWPEIRFAFPDAELHIFYEVSHWLNNMAQHVSESGRRAHFIAERLQALASHGVVLRGAVSPSVLANELLQADLMLYPCDTITYTEGFGVACLDSHAAGVLPILTDADALGEIYSDSGSIMVPRGEDRTWTDRFLETTLEHLQHRPTEEQRQRVREFASRYDWPNVAKIWGSVIEGSKKA